MMPHVDNARWQEYFDRLTALARKRLRNIPQQLKNEEDIACSAIKSFLRGMERNGVRPAPENDFDLWPLLATIAAGKCADLIVYLKARKRDVARITDAELDEITCHGPGPGSVAEQKEGRIRLLGMLKDDRSRRIAEWKVERLTNKEIAEKLDCSERTVEREVESIRVQWEMHVNRLWDESGEEKA